MPIGGCSPIPLSRPRLPFAQSEMAATSKACDHGRFVVRPCAAWAAWSISAISPRSSFFVHNTTFKNHLRGSNSNFKKCSETEREAAPCACGVPQGGCCALGHGPPWVTLEAFLSFLSFFLPNAMAFAVARHGACPRLCSGRGGVKCLVLYGA